MLVMRKEKSLSWRGGLIYIPGFARHRPSWIDANWTASAGNNGQDNGNVVRRIEQSQQPVKDAILTSR